MRFVIPHHFRYFFCSRIHESFSFYRTNTDFTMEIFIGLKNPLHVEIVTDETATDTIVLRTIHIKFSFGILTHTLENVMRIMVNS